MQTAEASLGVIRATITRVEMTYAVAYPNNDVHDLKTSESVTFSLKNWQGKHGPEAGQTVDLSGVYLFSKGWRATTARPVKPGSHSNK